MSSVGRPQERILPRVDNELVVVTRISVEGNHTVLHPGGLMQLAHGLLLFLLQQWEGPLEHVLFGDIFHSLSQEFESDIVRVTTYLWEIVEPLIPLLCILLADHFHGLDVRPNDFLFCPYFEGLTLWADGCV